MALIFQATAHAIRGQREEMEEAIAEAAALAPDDRDVLGCAWGHCRATFSLLAEDRGEAHAHMTKGAGLMLSSPAAIAPPFLGLWPLLGAALNLDPGGDAARVRSAHATRHLVVAALLGYADAIRAGRRGERGEAEAAFAAAAGGTVSRQPRRPVRPEAEPTPARRLRAWGPARPRRRGRAGPRPG